MSSHTVPADAFTREQMVGLVGQFHDGLTLKVRH
jgi:hypothetical protein